MSDQAVPAREPFLRLTSISKYFGTTRALKDMSLDISFGEILGLVGPNGAGKSTLIKVITGAEAPTSGAVAFLAAGRTQSGLTVGAAKEYGVACAYQELSLFTNLRVYENFLVNLVDHAPFAAPGWRRRGAQTARRFLDELFPDNGIDAFAPVSELLLPQRQMLEIAKAVSQPGLRLLILDEPTSSLTGDRITQLHDAMRGLAARGIAVIYISHKLDEIERVCDRVVVMKGGTTQWSGHRASTSMRELVEILGGKVQADRRAVQENRDLPLALRIERLSTDTLHDINLHVRKGEIVGISGLQGAGQTELIREVFRSSKSIRRSPHIRLEADAAYASGDRHNEGIFPLWDIADNTVISSLGAVTRFGLIRPGRLLALANFWFDKLKFTAHGVRDQITSLSGGNQQKALLARCLATESDLVLLNDPTSGVDVETKQEIYRLLDEAKQQGKAILLHSTEDLEMEQCDRVYIMHEGRIVKELVGDQVSVQNVIATSFREKSRGTAADGAPRTDGAPHADARTRRDSLARRVINNGAFLAFATLIAIFFVNSLFNRRITSYLGIQLLYSSAIPLVFIALGQMFIVITGGIDLGNGQSVGLLNVIIAFVLTSRPGLGVVSILLVVLAYAGLAAVIYYTRIPAIVITLGASFVWLGLALTVAPVPGGSAPSWLSAFYNFKFPLVPMPIVIAAAAAGLSFWIVRRSKYGMIINAAGNNPTAVSRAGWSQFMAMAVAYALSGLMTVIGALMLTAIASSGDANSSRAYNMLSIATIILGGCSFFGGISSPVGVVVASLGISSIAFLLTFIGIDSNMQSAVTGLILIAALALKLISARMEVRR
jgi:ribose transport system ATP-binding protein